MLFPLPKAVYSMYHCDRRTTLRSKGILGHNLILFVSVDMWDNPDGFSEKQLGIDRTEIRM